MTTLIYACIADDEILLMFEEAKTFKTRADVEEFISTTTIIYFRVTYLLNRKLELAVCMPFPSPAEFRACSFHGPTQQDANFNFRFNLEVLFIELHQNDRL